MTIEELIKRSGKTAREKGWWDKPRTLGEFISLCHSELSEALECSRDGHKIDRVWMADHKPEGVLVELADVYIRIADFIAQNNLTDEFIRSLGMKLSYNEMRPYRHGKSF